MFGVQGQFICEILIDGKELPIQLGGFEEILVVENSRLYIPQFRIAVYDGAGVLDSLRAVVDGTPVSIMMGTSTNSDALNRYEFRSFGPPRNTPVGARSLYTIHGVLDVMKYFRGQAKGSFKGKSFEAITKIATDCSMEAIVDNTDDEMSWLFGQKTHCAINKFIAAHGWADDKSIMVLGVNAQKKVIYKNLEKLVREKPKMTFWSGGSDDQNTKQSQVLAYDIRAQAGLNNAMFGYGSTAIEQKLDGIITKMKETEVSLFSESTAINSEVKTQVGRVRTPYVPPDAGNTHGKFRKAEYQNRQALSTFSTNLEVMLSQFSGATLFDLVNFHISPKANAVSAKTYNGKYIVSAISKLIKGTSYYEKHRLVTQGRQVDATGDLIG